MALSDIAVEHEVFVREGERAIGAVRRVDRDHLTVWFEGYGDVRITADQIAGAHDGKVIVRPDSLPPDLQARLGHIHDGESRA